MLRALRSFGPDVEPEGSTGGASQGRMTSTLRALLAATALLVTFIDPAEPSRYAALVYTALTLYLAYAVSLYFIVRRRRDLPMVLWHLLPFADICAYAALMGLSGGSNSIYFILLFFGVLTASLHGGFRFGLAATAISLVLFVIVGLASRPTLAEFDLNRFLLRSTSLALLGYLTAYVGGYEARLRRRLALLRNISVTSNPRFGPDRMLGHVLEHLRAFYDADLCVAVLPAESGSAHALRAVTRHSAGRLSDSSPLSPAMAASLLALGQDEVACGRPNRWRWPLLSRMAGRGPRRGHPNHDELAELFGVLAYLTVPLRSTGRRPGRLYIASTEPRFDRDDGEFLLQAADQIMPALIHVELVERMATRAADDERRRIALDIHDRIIQPQIGLQFGINAVEQLAAGAGEDTLPAVRRRLQALQGLARHALSDVRGYVRGLHDGSPADGDGRLADSLRRFGSRFHEATGIQVSVDAPDGLSVDHRLAAEVFSMATEAVSNVRRHTSSTHVDVRLRFGDGRLTLRVENPEDPATRAEPFVPRSISERAAASGGTIAIERGGATGTAVVIELPL